MRRAPPVVAALVITAACGPKRPPPSFAPDPGLVSQIRELRMSTNATACPGESFGAAYTAVLNDGSLVPFETRYDQDHPPRLPGSPQRSEPSRVPRRLPSSRPITAACRTHSDSAAPARARAVRR